MLNNSQKVFTVSKARSESGYGSRIHVPWIYDEPRKSLDKLSIWGGMDKRWDNQTYGLIMSWEFSEKELEEAIGLLKESGFTQLDSFP